MKKNLYIYKVNVEIFVYNPKNPITNNLRENNYAVNILLPFNMVDCYSFFH